MRVLLLIAGYVLCVFCMRHARKVRAHPELSIVADKNGETRPFRQSRQYTGAELTATRKWVLLIFAAFFRGDDLRRGGSRLVDGGNLRRLSGGGDTLAITRMGEEAFTSTLSTAARGICSAWR